MDKRYRHQPEEYCPPAGKMESDTTHRQGGGGEGGRGGGGGGEGGREGGGEGRRRGGGRGGVGIHHNFLIIYPSLFSSLLLPISLASFLTFIF